MRSAEVLYSTPQSVIQRNNLRSDFQIREVVGSKAFNLEYFNYTTSKEMYDDIVSYLGEYRFHLKKYDYEMVYAKGEDGIWALRDTARGESLRTKAKRILEERRYRGDQTHREENEEIGINLLDQQLRFAQVGDRLRWMSPPGPEDEGYGEYGFLYEGRIDKRDDGTLRLHMSAFRIEGEIDQYNNAFTQLTGIPTMFTSADDFLRSPRVIRGEAATLNAEDVLWKNFRFKIDQKQEENFREAVKRVEPLIYEVIEKIKHADKTEKVEAFNVLENYFLKQKKYIENEKSSGEKILFLGRRVVSIAALRGAYGYEAPVTKGSCGSTSQSNSLTIGGGNLIDNFMKGFIPENGGCNCVDRSDNHYHCPGCDKKYADETSKKPEERTKKCNCGFKFGC